jgi:hypothetical protein
MEIFVNNIPYEATPRKVGRIITSAVKKAFGDQVAFKWQQFKKKGCGALTLPTFEMGQRFLGLNSGGLRIRDRRGEYRTVRFCRSKKDADPRLVEGLQKQMEEIKQKQNDSDDDYNGDTQGMNLLIGGVDSQACDLSLSNGACGNLVEALLVTQHFN